MDEDEAGNKRKLDIQKLEEIRNNAYKNEVIYKEKTKANHDKRISDKTFKKGSESAPIPFKIQVDFRKAKIKVVWPLCGYKYL